MGDSTQCLIKCLNVRVTTHHAGHDGDGDDLGGVDAEQVVGHVEVDGQQDGEEARGHQADAEQVDGPLLQDDIPVTSRGET